MGKESCQKESSPLTGKESCQKGASPLTKKESCQKGPSPLTEKESCQKGASLLTEVLETIKKYNLIKDGDRIVLGVSGGPDSIAMLSNRRPKICRKLLQKNKCYFLCKKYRCSKNC